MSYFHGKHFDDFVDEIKKKTGLEVAIITSYGLVTCSNIGILPENEFVPADLLHVLNIEFFQKQTSSNFGALKNVVFNFQNIRMMFSIGEKALLIAKIERDIDLEDVLAILDKINAFINTQIPTITYDFIDIDTDLIEVKLRQKLEDIIPDFNIKTIKQFLYYLK